MNVVEELAEEEEEKVVGWDQNWVEHVLRQFPPLDFVPLHDVSLGEQVDESL